VSEVVFIECVRPRSVDQLHDPKPEQQTRRLLSYVVEVEIHESI